MAKQAAELENKNNFLVKKRSVESNTSRPDNRFDVINIIYNNYIDF